MSVLENRPTAASISSAERVRTILAGASSLRLGPVNAVTDVTRHALTVEGSILFLPSDDSPDRIFAVTQHLPPQTVTVTALDVAPIPHPDRLRGAVEMTCDLQAYRGPTPPGIREHLAGPGPVDHSDPILCLRPTRISLTWHCEDARGRAASVDVDPAAYREAFPDPLLPHEAEALLHLHRDHPGAVAALAAYGAPGVRHTSVRPVVLDRHGVVLRLERADAAPLDVRLAFAHAVRCGCDLEAAMVELIERADPDGEGLSCAG
ncbi:DUF2470 domain-containing protein [Nocardioides dubius]|uniref:DUF2470 domain-containing protein n=1 Tax=Nocardioides dubius TaxID=317019 RepID=UPI0031D061E7